MFDSINDSSTKNKEIEKNFKKISFLKSLNDYSEKDKIKTLLSSFHQKEENNYFITQSNIVVGKYPRGPIFEKNLVPIPYSFVGPYNLFNQNKKILGNSKLSRYDSMNSGGSGSEKSIRRYSKLPSRKDKNSTHQKSAPKNNYLMINDKNLQKIYDDIKTRVNNKKSNDKENSKIMNGVPRTVKNSLLYQENLLKKYHLINKLNDRFQKILSKKCKKTSKELLMNKSLDYQIKNQERLYKEKHLDDDVKYKDNLWNITLRNPEVNGTFERIGYQNIGTPTHPMYTVFNLNRAYELVRDPNYLKTEGNIPSTEIKSIKNQTPRNGLQLLNSINGMGVNGKNLLDLEIKRETGFRGKKKYYKPNEIDIMLQKERYKKTTAELTGESFNERVYAKKFEKSYFYNTQRNPKFF